ncbi:uncharacterized protein LOC118467213 [Anopheles albimanus]|uniref:uncharacterized protein LOC118467213 n=1 Tax=Anopheles albimanus TaxID=7167 RepID=UPI00163F4567|nr:uncharacterized protein LOC118467213 [Anopheles albimanus]XP_035793335.1 uncharacterized protein LOC118467213 [Anopheles albimanus]
MLFARDSIILYLMQLMALEVSYIVLGLDSVHIKVPVAVPLGTSVTLVCECDLSDEDLYSVKWYKGKREFFRYTSKEIPSIKIFPKAGISVNVNLSNASHLVLDGIEPQSSGRYSCEITEAAPSFHTQIASRTMHVVDLPEVDPRIDDMKSYYGADEFLEVRCTAGASLPAAKLTWLINDRPLLLPLQEPSRLESLTLPADDGPSSSSGSSNSSSSKRSSSSTNSSSKQKASVKSSSQVPAAVSQTLDQERMEEGHEQSGNMVVGGAPTASALTEGLMATDTARTKPGSRTTNASASAASEKFGNRYEVAVSQLKLLLEHGHFQMGKLKVECIARIFDLYERSVVGLADENYPQVRVLSNSDNGVHFSFMSDKDEASTSRGRHWLPSWSLVWLLAGIAQLIATSCWTSWNSRISVVHSFG